MNDVSSVSRDSIYVDIRSTTASKAAVGFFDETAIYGNVSNTSLAKLSILA